MRFFGVGTQGQVHRPSFEIRKEDVQAKYNHIKTPRLMYLSAFTCYYYVQILKVTIHIVFNLLTHSFKTSFMV